MDGIDGRITVIAGVMIVLMMHMVGSQREPLLTMQIPFC
jgi:hypothetical protein